LPNLFLLDSLAADPEKYRPSPAVNRFVSVAHAPILPAHLLSGKISSVPPSAAQLNRKSVPDFSRRASQAWSSFAGWGGKQKNRGANGAGGAGGNVL